MLFKLSISFGVQVQLIDLKNGLIGCYPFLGNARDESGNNNHGTVYGATLTTDRFGQANNAYKFDGFNDYIEVPSANFLNNNYTFSLWTAAEQIPELYDYTYMLSLGGRGGDNSLDISNQGNALSGWVFGAYHQGGGVSECSSGSLPTVNTWVHVVGTRDDNAIKLYINGQLICTRSTSGRRPLYGNNPIRLTFGARCVIRQFFKG